MGSFSFILSFILLLQYFFSFSGLLAVFGWVFSIEKISLEYRENQSILDLF